MLIEKFCKYGVCHEARECFQCEVEELRTELTKAREELSISNQAYDTAAARAETNEKSLKMLYGQKFSDRCYHALKSRVEEAEKKLQSSEKTAKTQVKGSMIRERDYKAEIERLERKLGGANGNLKVKDRQIAQLVEENKDLKWGEVEYRYALNALLRWHGRTSDANTTFEDIGKWFFDDEGQLRPGKDQAGYGMDEDERRDLFRKWVDKKSIEIRVVAQKVLNHSEEKNAKTQP